MFLNSAERALPPGRRRVRDRRLLALSTSPYCCLLILFCNTRSDPPSSRWRSQTQPLPGRPLCRPRRQCVSRSGKSKSKPNLHLPLHHFRTVTRVRSFNHSIDRQYKLNPTDGPPRVRIIYPAADPAPDGGGGGPTPLPAAVQSPARARQGGRPLRVDVLQRVPVVSLHALSSMS
jgi:hypothetical protein